MKNIYLILMVLLLIIGCTEPVTEIITEKTNTIVKDGMIKFCNHELLDTWCWSDNNDTWFDLDLSSYTNGQSIVEITLVFVDSLDPRIDTCSITIRKNDTNQTYDISSNHINRSKVLLTDENGHIEWKHDMNVDVSRKINIKIYLTMIQK